MGKNTQPKKNNYIWILGITAVFVIVTAITGIAAFQFYRKGVREVMDDKRYSQYYVMIVEDSKSAFWQSVYQGAYEKGLEKDIYVDLLGSNFSHNYSREDMMEIAMYSGVDGIIVEADESEEMSALIDTAVALQIPVVTLYGDNTHSDRCSFVGVGSYNLGREYGRQVLQIARQKKEAAGEEKEEGDRQEEFTQKVTVLVNAYAMDSGQNILCSGIQETIEKEKEAGMSIEITLVSVDDTNAFSVEESIRDIFMEEELPDTIVCLNELNTACVYQAVIDYNKVGEVSILGYYDSETIINAIDRNVIYATIAVDTKQMGGFCIEALTEYHELGYTSQYFTADITLINKGNVSLYLGKEDAHAE